MLKCYVFLLILLTLEIVLKAGPAKKIFKGKIFILDFPNSIR